MSTPEPALALPASAVAATDPPPRWALTALCLTQVVGWGVLFYSFPVALTTISADAPWSPSTSTAAFTTTLLVAAAAAIPVGRHIDRHGPRGVMTWGSVLAAAATALVGLAPGAGAFVAAWALVGLAQAAVLYPPAFTAVTRWYGTQRLRALTTVTLVGGLASVIFAPLTAVLLEHLTWRATYLVLAAVLLVVTVPAHALGLRGPWPAPVVGAPPDRAGRAGHAQRPGRRPETSAGFLTLAASVALTAFILAIATVHLVPLLVGRGLSGTQAALVLGLSGGAQLVGRLVYLPLVRRTTPDQRVVLLTASSAVGVVLLGLVARPAAVVVGLAVVVGVAKGAYTVLQSTIVADRWGVESYGRLHATLTVPAAVAVALSPWAGGALGHVLGGHPPMFVAVGLLGVPAVLLVERVRRPVEPREHS